MSNGLSSKILNKTSLGVVTTWLVNSVCKISWKSVENWLINPRISLILVDEFIVNLTIVYVIITIFTFSTLVLHIIPFFHLYLFYILVYSATNDLDLWLLSHNYLQNRISIEKSCGKVVLHIFLVPLVIFFQNSWWRPFWIWPRYNPYPALYHSLCPPGGG